MSQAASANGVSPHYLFEDKPTLCSKNCQVIAQITAFIISFITLTVAVFFTLVSTGALAQSYPLYAFGEIAPFASGILLGLAAVSTLIGLGILIGQIRCKNASSLKPKEYEGFVLVENPIEPKEDFTASTGVGNVSAFVVIPPKATEQQLTNKEIVADFEKLPISNSTNSQIVQQFTSLDVSTNTDVSTDQQIVEKQQKETLQADDFVDVPKEEKNWLELLQKAARNAFVGDDIAKKEGFVVVPTQTPSKEVKALMDEFEELIE